MITSCSGPVSGGAEQWAQGPAHSPSSHQAQLGPLGEDWVPPFPVSAHLSTGPLTCVQQMRVCLKQFVSFVTAFSLAPFLV